MKMNRALLLVARWLGQASGVCLSALRQPLAAEYFAACSARAKQAREIELLRSRLERLPPHQRPHYSPSQRLEILWHQLRYGLSRKETARIFVVSVKALDNWHAGLRHGFDWLVHSREPMNKLPDLVREVVWRLKREQWTWGTRRIAGVLAKLGLKASRTSVQRILRKGPPRRRQKAMRLPKGKIRRPGIRPKRPNHIYFTDFTYVVGFMGLFKIRIGAVIDGFSRKILAIDAWRREPTARDARNLLRRAVRAGGGKPRHLVTDRGTQYTAKSFVRYLKKRKIRHRYGAVGCSGSIARMERVWLSLKTELVDFAFAMMPLAWVRRRLNSYVRWYNACRPHGGIGLRTPNEVFRRRPPRRRRQLRHGDRLVLSVDHVDGVRSLAKYTLRRVA